MRKTDQFWFSAAACVAEHTCELAVVLESPLLHYQSCHLMSCCHLSYHYMAHAALQRVVVVILFLLWVQFPLLDREGH